MKAEANPTRYRELSEPYESDKLANEMLDGFFEAVKEARIKFQVRREAEAEAARRYGEPQGTAQSSGEETK